MLAKCARNRERGERGVPDDLGVPPAASPHEGIRPKLVVPVVQGGAGLKQHPHDPEPATPAGDHEGCPSFDRSERDTQEALIRCQNETVGKGGDFHATPGLSLAGLRARRLLANVPVVGGVFCRTMSRECGFYEDIRQDGWCTGVAAHCFCKSDKEFDRG